MMSRPLRTPLLLLALSTCLLVAAGGLSPIAPPASAAATGVLITSAASGRCLDVSDGVREPNAQVIVYDCNGLPNQVWTLTAEGELKVYDDSTCLDVFDDGVTAPGPVQTFPCHGKANQRFELTADGALVGVGSRLCLDVTRERTENKTLVQMWPCNGQDNQRWTTGPVPTEPTEPSVVVPRPDTCLDPGTCVAGRGLLVRDTEEGELLYQDEQGKVWFPEVPAALEGTSFATYDDYPGYAPGQPYTDDRDSRTDEVVEAVQTDTDGTLTIALPAADLAGDGWTRVGDGDGADLQLDGEGREAGDPSLSYWLYSFDAEAGTWVEVPELPAGAKPPFVFAAAGTLTFANPLPLPNGVVIDTSSLVSNPSMTIVPGEFDADGDGRGDGDADGDGTAENDVYLANVSGVPQWKVWRSLDQGLTWERWGRPSVNLNRQTMFWHDGSVYLMGWLKHPEDVPDENARAGIIYRSTDGGQTFPESTPLPFDAGDAPSNVQVSDGRIWKATYGEDAAGDRGASLVSAPVDADLMDPDSWTEAVGQSSAEWRRSDVEGTTVLMRDGRVANVAPIGGGKMSVVYSDGPTRTTYDPEVDDIALAHNGKFSMQYDAGSDRYWTLVNGPNGRPRHVLNLYSSGDLKTWTLEKEVLRGPSSRFQGFQYANMLIEGDDIVFVSRTAFENRYTGNSDRWHNGNMFTFHRIEDFRSLS